MDGLQTNFHADPADISSTAGIKLQGTSLIYFKGKIYENQFFRSNFRKVDLSSNLRQHQNRHFLCHEVFCQMTAKGV